VLKLKRYQCQQYCCPPLIFDKYVCLPGPFCLAQGQLRKQYLLASHFVNGSVLYFSSCASKQFWSWIITLYLLRYQLVFVKNLFIITIKIKKPPRCGDFFR